MKELRDKLRAALTSARALVDKAKGEKRGLTAEEQAQYDGFKTEIESTQRAITAFQESERLQAELDAIAPETQAGQRSDDPTEEARARVEVLTPKYERG